MPTSNVVSSHAEGMWHQSSTNLAHAAGQTNASAVGGSAGTLIASYFHHTSFNIFINYRNFMSFDLSSLSGTVTGVTLTITRNNNYSFPDFFFLASEASDAVGTSDYLDGIVGASSYPFTSSATKFIDSAWTPNDGGNSGDDVTITLNSAAVSHANSVIGSGKFKVAMVNTYDFNNTYGSTSFSNLPSVQGVVFRSTQHSTSGDHPVLNVTTAAGYGHDVMGVGNSNISSVNGIATANVSKINGV